MASNRERIYKPMHYTMLDEMCASPTQPLAPALRHHQLTRMYQSLAQLESAEEATNEDWCIVSDSVNLTETLIKEMQVCIDTHNLLGDAVQAMAQAGMRRAADQPMELDDDEVSTIRALLDDYADLLNVLPARVMIRCHRLTEHRLYQIRAGSVRPHDIKVAL